MRANPHMYTFHQEPVYPSQSFEVDSLYEHFRNDEATYKHLLGFATNYKKPIKYVLSNTNGLFQCECFIGELRAVGQSLKKKSVGCADPGAHASGEQHAEGAGHGLDPQGPLFVLPAQPGGTETLRAGERLGVQGGADQLREPARGEESAGGFFDGGIPGAGAEIGKNL